MTMTPKTTDDAVIPSSDRTAMADPLPPPWPRSSAWTSRIHHAWVRVIQRFQAMLPVVLELLPSLTATLMAAAIILTKPAAHWLGNFSFLTYPFIHLFYYPNPKRTIGGQLELFLIGLVGGTIGCAVSFLIVACAVWADERYAYNRHPDVARIPYDSGQARVIGVMGMLVLTFGAAYVQSAVPRMKPGARICLFDMVWIITSGATKIQAQTFLGLFWPTLVSGGVCLIATMLIRPKTANQVVVQQLTTFLETVDAVLSETTSSFFHPPTRGNSSAPEDEAAVHRPRVATPRLVSLRLTLLQTLNSIGSTFHAASYEISFARISARQYAVVLPILGRIRTWIACGMGLDVELRAPLPPPAFGGKGLKNHARPVIPKSDPLPSLPLPGQRRILAKMLADHLRARQSTDSPEEGSDDDWVNDTPTHPGADTENQSAPSHPTEGSCSDPWSRGQVTFEQFELPVQSLTDALHPALGTIISALVITTGLSPPGSIPDVKPPPRSFWERSVRRMKNTARGLLKYFHLPVPASKSVEVYAETLARNVTAQQVALDQALSEFAVTLDTLFSGQFRRSALVHAAARATAEKATGQTTDLNNNRHHVKRPSNSSQETCALHPSEAQAFLHHLAVFDPDMYSVASLLVSLLELAHEVSSFLGLAQRGVDSWLAHRSFRIHLPLGRMTYLLPSGMSELGPAVPWSGLNEEIRAQGMSRVSGASLGRGGPAAQFTSTVVEEGLLDDALHADANAQQAQQDAAAAIAARARDEDRVAPSSPGNRPEQEPEDHYWTTHDPKELFPMDPDAQWLNRARAWANDGKNASTKPNVVRKLSARFHTWARSPRILSYRLALSRWIRSVHRSRHIKFAIKLAAGNVLLSLPIWVGGSGRSWFANQRAQWLIITYVWCLETSTAATLMVSLQRMIGTIMGVFTGVIIYEISRGNGVGLGACMMVVELVSAYFLTQTWATSFGVVYGVTYSVVALIPYLGLEYHTIVKLGWNRGYQIFLGIVAAMVVNLLIWPYHARSKLAHHVGDLARDIGVYYVALSRHMMQAGFAPSPAITSYIARREAQLSARLSTCRGLLALVTSEVSLVPDPLGAQVQILGELQAMTDRLTGLRMCREHGLRHVRRAAVINVMELRRAFISSFLLCLWSVGQALSTRSPLPQFLPSPRTHLRALTLGVQQQIVLLGLAIHTDTLTRHPSHAECHKFKAKRSSPTPTRSNKRRPFVSKTTTSQSGPVPPTRSCPTRRSSPRARPLRRYRTAPPPTVSESHEHEHEHDPIRSPAHWWSELPSTSLGPLSYLNRPHTRRQRSPRPPRNADRTARLSPRPSYREADGMPMAVPEYVEPRGTTLRLGLTTRATAPATTTSCTRSSPLVSVNRASRHRKSLRPTMSARRQFSSLAPSLPPVGKRGRSSSWGGIPSSQSSKGTHRTLIDLNDQAQGWEDASPIPAHPHHPNPKRLGRKHDQVVEAAVLFLLTEHVLLSEIVESVEEVLRLCRITLGEASFVDQPWIFSSSL